MHKLFKEGTTMQRKSVFMYACLLFCTFFTLAQAVTLTVTTTADSGPGSLRQALTDANTNPAADTIIFNIPQTDVGYNPETGVWTIQPVTDLSRLESDSTFIDATTQTTNQGNLNLYGPEIELNGGNVLENGFYITGAYNKIQGLVINHFTYVGVFIRFTTARGNSISGNYIGTDATGITALGCETGIRIHGAAHNTIGGSIETERNLLSGNGWGIIIADSGADSNIVIGNYIGVDATGNTALGNTYGGILITENSTDNKIGGISPGERNVISGSTYRGNITTGNGISIERCSGNRILGNFIGTNKDGNAPLPNIDYGISINGAAGNIIGGLESGAANVISGNDWGGIFIRFTESQNNVITGNFIGTDLTATLNLGNFAEGVYLDYGARKNCIGPQNIIINNGAYGVQIAHDTTRYNTITQNIIANHNNKGIFYNTEASSVIATPPQIQQVTDSYVSGTSFPGWTVEIFSDTLDEASIYEGSIIADETGNFTWYGTVTGPNVCATATDTSGSTSEFSIPFTTGIKTDPVHKPKGFALHQNYPNPFNPITTISYKLPNNGHVLLEIFDATGRKITTLVNQTLKAGSHTISWNGRNAAGQPVPSGVYFYRLRSENFNATRKMLLLR